jgi:integrase
MTTDTIRNSLPNSTTWDEEVTGLHLRVSAAGIKRWFLYYRTKAGMQRRPKLGEYPSVTLQEARQRAKAILNMVAIGQDPSGEWRAARQEITVAVLFRKAWDAHWDKPRFRRSNHAQEVWRIYTRHIAQSLGRLRLSEITPGTVREWHDAMSSIPVGANRALEVLSRLFSFAEEREIRAQGTNPCRLVLAFPEHKRCRYATEEEIIKIGQLLERDKNAYPQEVAFIYLLILTGSRPSAIARANRDQFRVDGESGYLLVVGKSFATTGDKDVIILPAAATRILQSLPSRSDGVLFSIPFPRKYWERIRDEAGCPDLWGRDWRRTFATVGFSAGVEIGTLGELLNHKDVKTTQRYAKIFPHTRRQAAGVIADRLESLLSRSSRRALPPSS